MNKLSTCVLLIAMTSLGCMDVEGDDALDGDEDTEELGTIESALIEGVSYCIDQSYASAGQVNNDVFADARCERGSQPYYVTQLSRNHPVRLIRNCTGGTYVFAQSYWNNVTYHLRASALRRC